jgi:hypothetical protein
MFLEELLLKCLLILLNLAKKENLLLDKQWQQVKNYVKLYILLILKNQNHAKITLSLL